MSGNIFLIGDPEMVAEFGEACHAAGYTVSAQRSTPGGIIPAYFRKPAGIPRSVRMAVELTNTDREQKRKNLQALEKALSASKIILSSSVTVTAGEQASWLRHPGRLVGISALPTLISHVLAEVAPAATTAAASITAARDFYRTLGKEVVVVQDRIGMVMPRILCSLVNEAFFALMDNIADPHDIDIAMKLGTNYPFGPIEWADKITVHQIFHVLEALHSDLGEERYRIAPLLRQMAAKRRGT